MPGTMMEGVKVTATIVGGSEQYEFGVVVDAQLPSEPQVQRHHLDVQYPAIQARILVRTGESTELLLGVYIQPEGESSLLLGLGDDDFSFSCPGAIGH